MVNLSKIAAIRADNESKFYSICFDGYDGEILLSRNKYTDMVDLLKQKFAGIRF